MAKKKFTPTAAQVAEMETAGTARFRLFGNVLTADGLVRASPDAPKIVSLPSKVFKNGEVVLQKDNDLIERVVEGKEHVPPKDTVHPTEAKKGKGFDAVNKLAPGADPAAAHGAARPGR